MWAGVGKFLLFHEDMMFVLCDIVVQHLHLGVLHAVEWPCRLGVIGISGVF